jgi:hypothetical protein
LCGMFVNLKRQRIIKGLCGEIYEGHPDSQQVRDYNIFFATLGDINNDEKATGNHSEETVVSISVVLLVISRCICIVFSDDLSLSML